MYLPRDCVPKYYVVFAYIYLFEKCGYVSSNELTRPMISIVFENLIISFNYIILGYSPSNIGHHQGPIGCSVTIRRRRGTEVLIKNYYTYMLARERQFSKTMTIPIVNLYSTDAVELCG